MPTGVLMSVRRANPARSLPPGRPSRNWRTTAPAKPKSIFRRAKNWHGARCRRRRSSTQRSTRSFQRSSGSCSAMADPATRTYRRALRPRWLRQGRAARRHRYHQPLPAGEECLQRADRCDLRRRGRAIGLGRSIRRPMELVRTAGRPLASMGEEQAELKGRPEKRRGGRRARRAAPQIRTRRSRSKPLLSTRPRDDRASTSPPSPSAKRRSRSSSSSSSRRRAPSPTCGSAAPRIRPST